MVVGEWLVCGARYLVARAGAGARAQLCRQDSQLPQCPGGAIHIREHGDDLDHSDGAIRNQHHIQSFFKCVCESCHVGDLSKIDMEAFRMGESHLLATLAT